MMLTIAYFLTLNNSFLAIACRTIIISLAKSFIRLAYNSREHCSQKLLAHILAAPLPASQT